MKKSNTFSVQVCRCANGQRSTVQRQHQFPKHEPLQNARSVGCVPIHFRADGARACIASPSGGRSPCLSCPCQCPFPVGGPAHSRHSQDIGIDFGVAARFTQNNQKKDRRVRHPSTAPCNRRTSQGATRQLRTLRLKKSAFGTQNHPSGSRSRHNSRPPVIALPSSTWRCRFRRSLLLTKGRGAQVLGRRGRD